MANNTNSSWEHCFFITDFEFNKLSNTITSVLNCVSAPVALFGNLGVLLAFCLSRRLRTPSNLLLAGLAFSDMLTGFIVQPLDIANALQENLYGETSCSLYMSFELSTWLLLMSSFLTLTAISCERFAALTLHLRYQQMFTMKRAAMALIMIWLISLSLNVIRLLLLESLFWCITLTTVSICLVLILLTNYVLIKAVQRHRKLIRSHQVVQRNKTPRSRDAAVIYVFAAVLICYIPDFVVIIHTLITGGTDLTKFVANIAESVTFLTSSINPAIYCWRIEEIRREIARLLGIRESHPSFKNLGSRSSRHDEGAINGSAWSNRTENTTVNYSTTPKELIIDTRC
ncbi:predicted protein [Nematostella vectensis]|uniref:G-protein coupled receptors family 1 profile domain-containing protein n=1 Tax=Nematostella vectensis TaxID=45351 RepID=A7RX85_NEMVE|nr:histamine H2 receptor [Nematostella vectensis]EDO43920.1 predicted protein [Nematostella vectensis]|eukprot:XP_001635983.1 predicted protein [Nematostella vectensis]